jgi:hypothetical protein
VSGHSPGKRQDKTLASANKIISALTNVNAAEPSRGYQHPKFGGSLMHLESLIDQYVDTRRRRGLLSTQLALRALKQVIPTPPISDSRLVDMLAKRAVAHGLVVHFDHAGENVG